jgi:type IV secretion system protein VirB10
VPGDVNSFFWKRFGGALLLSLVSDASSAASNRVSGVNQTMQAPNSAANTALENDMRIKPVLRAPQGSNLMIVAAKDLDFSNVYSLRLKR